MQERRSTTRTRTYLGAQIAFNSLYSTMDCLVRNITEQGAALALPSTTAVPSAFELTIPLKGMSRTARVVWREPSRLGVVFDAQAPDTFPSLDTALTIKKLEAERDALARRVAQLCEPA